MANMQCVVERQLRRYIRRLDEALVLSHKQLTIPTGLMTHILQGAVADERPAVHQRRWGDARAKAKERLNDIIQAQQQLAVSKWRTKVRTVPGACKWLRQEMATPHILKDEQGFLIYSKPEAAQALKNYWTKTFGTLSDSVDIPRFMNLTFRTVLRLRYRICHGSMWSKSPKLLR